VSEVIKIEPLEVLNFDFRRKNRVIVIPRLCREHDAVLGFERTNTPEAMPQRGFNGALQ
jgi:hypothetical protein